MEDIIQTKTLSLQYFAEVFELLDYAVMVVQHETQIVYLNYFSAISCILLAINRIIIIRIILISFFTIY